MKKLILAAFALFCVIITPVLAADPFTSKQLAPTPVDTYILQTNGSKNIWVPNSGGGSGTSQYWNYNATTNVLSPATSTTGLLVTASSTIGNGTNGLTISGRATTTGNAYFASNVGIGSTSPYAKLSVTNTGSSPSFVVEDSTSPDTTPFIITASGNVGIGTTSPTEKLGVQGDLTVTGQLSVGGLSFFANDMFIPDDHFLNIGQAKMYFNSTFNNVAFLNDVSGGGLQFQTASYLQFQRTSDFGSLFSIYMPGTIEFFDGLGNETNGVFRINGWNTAAGARRYTQVQQTNGGYFNFTGQDANVLGVTFNSGNVGIGTTTAGAQVTVGTGDVYIASSTRGIILKSPDGTCARGTISDIDVLSFASVTCP